MKYCPSIHKTCRRKTRTVLVGSVEVGGDHPICAQSMTTSSTRDIEETVEQIIRLADAGCEIARVTVQGKKEAHACEGIKNQLIQKGYTIPIVADIHFYPPAALLVAEFVDKVRINPGNFVDKRATFQVLEYTDETYAQELKWIEEKFTPLVEKCRSLGRAMRIGTNHGSLSDRIMNRFGDTPQGMVESALEYARICRKNDFHNFLFSMKASNTQVMIQAYRLLVSEMDKLGWDYPLHLGVTEAGEGEDGRVKSAIGIGSLLLDGLGDTIRVSLTEDPWYEIDPCHRLISFAKEYEGTGVELFKENHRSYFEAKKRPILMTKPLHRDGTVGLSVSDDVALSDLGKGSLAQVDFVLSEGDGKKLKKEGFEILSPQNLEKAVQEKFKIHTETTVVRVLNDKNWPLIAELKPSLILLALPQEGRVHFARRFFEWLQENGLQIPVLLNFSYNQPWEQVVINASAECGSLLCDGLGEGLLLEGPYSTDSLRILSFNILQGCRMRTVKTEFISCPSCGRTLFNLQETSERIRQKTGHLPGVKVAIMGCIVNGPGEMADADFGYVGSKEGEVDLYVGKSCVEKGIPQHEADGRLIELIKAHNRWVDP